MFALIPFIKQFILIVLFALIVGSLEIKCIPYRELLDKELYSLHLLYKNEFTLVISFINNLLKGNSDILSFADKLGLLDVIILVLVRLSFPFIGLYKELFILLCVTACLAKLAKDKSTKAFEAPIILKRIIFLFFKAFSSVFLIILFENIVNGSYLMTIEAIVLTVLLGTKIGMFI